MVEVFEQNVQLNHIQSSKGNQLKWFNHGNWYKADYTGYEGLAEYVISKLFVYSDLKQEEYVNYDVETMRYKNKIYRGCKSLDFLPDGWQLITLERLFKNVCGQSLNKCIYSIENYESRLRFIVDQTTRITGLRDFGNYMSKLLTIDAIFFNEDRHTHNIAVLMDEKGVYQYCPFFDHGAALLSDTTMDYPLNVNIEDLMSSVRAKTFCRDFDEQLDIAEKLYGKQIHFNFKRKDIENILEKEKEYPEEEKRRVLDVIMWQRQKYQYLF